jgi:RNA polymerase sigma-B factor
MPPRVRPKHSHDDAPDTQEAFRRLAALPPGPRRDALSQDLVTQWLPMAHRLAARYRDRGEVWDDLRQVAALGLVKAVDRYDPERGAAFATYAVPTIEGELKRHFRDCSWLVHVPRRVQEARARVRAALPEMLRASDTQWPEPAAVAAYTGLTEREAAAGLEALDSFSPLSLDAPLRSQNGAVRSRIGVLADTLGAPDARLGLVVDRESVRPSLRGLTERERTVLYLRFVEDRTQSAIAAHLGVSQVHVSRLIQGVCRRIREEALGAPAPAGRSGPARPGRAVSAPAGGTGWT